MGTFLFVKMLKRKWPKEGNGMNWRTFAIVFILVLFAIFYIVKNKKIKIDILDGDGMVYKGHSTSELEEMALIYYTKKYNYKPSHAEAFVDEKDENIINIHLYDIVDDHTATVDWYAVDKYTAEGTNILGEEVDLME